MKTLILVSFALMVLAVPQMASAFNVRIDCPSTFMAGDSVCFTWVNDDSFDICGYSEPPWVIFNSDEGVVAPCGGPLVITTLPAGQSKRYCWDQKGCAGNQVPDGIYRVSIRFGTGESCTYRETINAAFSIEQEPTGSENKSWGKIKTLYR